jgi:hypothetical protein
MMTETEIQAALELAEKATPGPWLDEPATEEWKSNLENNGNFCRAARTLVPELCHALQEANAKLDAMTLIADDHAMARLHLSEKLQEANRQNGVMRKTLKHVVSRVPICDGCIAPDVSLTEHYDYIVSNALADCKETK